VRRTDDDGISGNHWSRMQADIGGLKIESLVIIELQIDDAVLSEGLNGRTGLGIEGDQTIAGRHIKDPLLVSSIGPIGQPATRQVPRRIVSTPSLTLAMHPNEFACDCV
jgi:hypothetical protein